MGFKSLKAKLTLIVSAMVIGSGLLISFLVTQHYNKALFDGMTSEAENLAHVVAFESTDKVLTNDLVSLQKMLDHQMDINSTIGYLFVSKDNHVIAHSFIKGVPAQLIKANGLGPGGEHHRQRIVSKDGEYYLDIAWPIFAGKAGALRLGLLERPYRRQVTQLWLQMGALTLGILFMAVIGSLLFIKRITQPLSELTLATQRIDKGEVGVRARVDAKDEMGRLAMSFNHMVARMEEYTRKLEGQTMELERAHYQTLTSCGIVQEIGALHNLNEVGPFLINRIQGILKCKEMVLLFLNSDKDFVYSFSESGAADLKEQKAIQSLSEIIGGLSRITFTKNMSFKPPLVPENFQGATRHAMIPVPHEGKIIGALVIACSEKCKCHGKDVDVVSLILTQVAGVINRVMSQEEEIRDLRRRMEGNAEFSGIVGKSPKMQVIYKLIEDIAPTDTTVLIQGESGTGKEMVARAIHQMSPRNDNPFIVINCSAYPATLLESELFGHEKGAFTGAIRQKAGRFEQADGGTVFLDEIGEISPSAQIKLLRVLQSKKFERLGGEHTLAVDMRILAATNKDLLQEVKNGHFREDLFYRLNVIPICLPPLRERRNDIPLLANHFLRYFAAEQEKKISEFSLDSMRLLLDYFWPGNVRELENSVEHAVVLAKGGRIETVHLPASIRTASSLIPAKRPRTMAEHERDVLTQVLDECAWNKKQAARSLGISRNTLYVKLKRYQITQPTRH